MKAKTIRSVLCLLLAVFMILPIMISCKDDGSNAGTNGDTPPVVGDKPYLDDLGAYDFGGEDFNVLSVKSDAGTYTKFDVPDLSGASNVDTALFNRNRIIESRFNIKFVPEEQSYTANYNTLKKEVEAGDYNYDLIMLINRDAYSAFVSNLIVPAAEIPHIDMSKEYYLRDINEMCSIDGYNIFAYSEESLYTFQRATLMVYNTEMVDELHLDDPRELVVNYKWTLEEMFNYLRKGAVINATTGESDVYGLYGHYSYLYAAFWFGAGQTILEQSTKYGYKYTIGSNDVIIDVSDQIVAAQDQGLIGHTSSHSELVSKFSDEGTFFTGTVIGRLNEIKDIDKFDFSVVPYPLYNEEQNNYASRVVDAWLHIVPTTCLELDRVGVILEALAGASLQYVFPAYYDEMMQYRILRDPGDIDMLEIVRKTRIFDLADVTWSQTLRAPLISRVFTDRPSVALSTAAATIKKTAETTIAEALQIVNERRK